MSAITPVVLRRVSEAPEDVSGLVYAEQVRQLYRLSPTGYLGTLAIASIVTYGLWNVGDNRMLAAWFASVCAITLGRYLLYRAYISSVAGRELTANQWANRFFAGAVAMGCMWGLLSAALFPHRSLPHQFLVIFVVGGMVLSAAGVLSTVKRVFYGFTLPAIIPLIMVLLLKGESPYVLMGVLGVVYTVVVLAFAAEMRANVLASTHAQEELRQTTQKLQALINASPLAIVVRDAEGRIERWNPAAERMFGWSEAEVLRRMVPWYPPGREEEGNRYRATILRGEAFSDVEAFRLRKDGTQLIVSLSGSPIVNDRGTAIGVMVIIADITQRKRFEMRQELQNAITALLGEGRVVEETLTRVIQAFCEKLGWVCGSRRVLDGERNVLRCAEAWGNGEPAVMAFVEETRLLLTPSTSKHSGVTRRVWDSGQPLWIADIQVDRNLKRGEAARAANLRAAIAFPVMIGDEFYGVMEFFAQEARQPEARMLEFARQLGSQIGQFIARKQAEQDLRFVATHDPLTALPNRSMFGERVSQALSQARRYNRRVALLFVDLDGFKEVNDTYGHDAGDVLLKEIAVRLRASLREGDVVGRIGGDEFVVLIEEFADADSLARVAQKILDTVAPPVVVRGHECRVTSSVGISAYPQDGRDSQTLLKNADSAMYRAKEQGKNRFVFYSL
jgi:diguanylate cyclase (GGDEF)-like protein/PAS domain S-box-containing protein